MKNTARLLLLIILVLFLTGCRQDTSREVSQTSGGLTATLSIDPYPPVSMKPITLLLALSDAEGHTLDGAQIVYNLTMPGMEMPPNQPQASDEGGGLYRAETTFTMSGDWQVQAMVTRNGEPITFTFDISVK
jgi:hypothetical protein